MRRLVMSMLSVCLATPVHAIELRWTSGSGDLAFTTARRCTLLVQSDPNPLPPEWRVLWVTDGCDVHAVQADSPPDPEQTAWACGVEVPHSLSQTEANETTAHFCSDGDPASKAEIVIDVSAPGRGRFQVVALDRASPSTVMTSNEIRLNGGVGDALPPAVLAVSYQHQGTDLRMTVVGAGLDTVQSLRLVGANHDWDLALEPTSTNGAALEARASALADVPACNLDVACGAGAVATSSVVAENTAAPQAALLSGHAGFRDPTSGYYPKDFAFVYVAGKYYVLYTRGNSSPSLDGKSLGFASSSDLQTWTVSRTNIMPVRDGVHDPTINWDYNGVWAPSIVKIGMTFNMFYTGVTTGGVQQIGYATSSDLVTWQRRDAPILTPQKAAAWAATDPSVFDGTTYPGRQFRDPFVMQDPSSAGRWLMYFSAMRARDNSYVVGVAATYSLGGTIDDWQVLAQPLASTDMYNQHQTQDAVIESPHLFSAWNKWWMGFTMGGDSQGYLRLAENGSQPYDGVPADSALWDHTDWTSYGGGYGFYNYGLPLKDFLALDNSVINWYASEYLRVPGDDYPQAPQHEYFAAAGNDSILVSQITWTDNDHFTLSVPVSAVPRGDSPLVFECHLVGFRPGRRTAEFRIDLPGPSHVRLSVFDAMGRKVQTVLDEEVRAGSLPAVWRGDRDDGHSVANGVYFARVETAYGRRVIKLPMLR